MKNLKIKLGLFSLLAALAVSVFLTSCEQSEIQPEEVLSQSDAVQINASIITAPAGLIEQEALDWAKDLPENAFSPVEDGADKIIESRWCTSHTNVGNCYSWSQSQGCTRTCILYEWYCGGWSGGKYVVIHYSQCRNCRNC